MRGILTADWHLGLSIDAKEKAGSSSMYEETLSSIFSMISYAKKESIKNLIVAGDIFHNNHPTSTQYKDVLEILNELDGAEIETHIIRGNHDFSRTGSDTLVPLSKVRGWEHIHIHTKESDFERIEGQEFCFVPYNRPLIIPSKRILKGTFLVIHANMEGAVLGAENLFLPVGVSTINQLNGFAGCFSGHIHKAQHFMLKDKPVLYPGSLVRCDFAEREEQKGFFVFELKLAKLKQEFISLPTRRYIQYEVSAKEALSFNYKDVKDSVVKVKIRANKYEEVKKKDLKELLYKRGAHYVRGVEIVLESRSKEVEIGQKFNLSDLALKYIDSAAGDSKKFVKEIAIRIMEEVMDETKTITLS